MPEAIAIVKETEVRKDRNKREYLVVKMDNGQSYTLWPPKEGSQSPAWDNRGTLIPGAETRLDYTQQGVYKNMDCFEVVGHVATPQASSSNDIHIVREVCLKAAVELAKPNIEKGTPLGSGEVLKIAEAFENWVTR